MSSLITVSFGLDKFKNKAVSPKLLSQEINASEIKTIMSGVTLDGKEVKIEFAGALSSEDLSLLNSIIGAHSGIPPKEQTDEIDSDTKAIAVTSRIAPVGHHEQLREWEFITAIQGSVHEKDDEGNDFNYAHLQFFDAEGIELTASADIDTKCVKTICDWTPDHNYSIKGGFVKQEKVPTHPVFFWAKAAPKIPKEFGGSKAFAEGGFNLLFSNAREAVGLEGSAATSLEYKDAVPPFGLFQNTIRFTVVHPPGYKHKVQCVLDIFLPPGV